MGIEEGGSNPSGKPGREPFGLGVLVICGGSDRPNRWGGDRLLGCGGTGREALTQNKCRKPVHRTDKETPWRLNTTTTTTIGTYPPPCP